MYKSKGGIYEQEPLYKKKKSIGLERNINILKLNTTQKELQNKVSEFLEEINTINTKHADLLYNISKHFEAYPLYQDRLIKLSESIDESTDTIYDKWNEVGKLLYSETGGNND